jgi:DNA-binding MarR family transcriptional regulator
MTISTTNQETQARVLVGLQRRVQAGSFNSATARYIALLLRSPEHPLSTQQVAAALKLLEDKGLVERTRPEVGRTLWFITQAGLGAEVK